MKHSRVLKTCLNRAAVFNERLQVLNMFVLHIISGFYHSEKVSVNKIVVFVRFKEKFFVLFYVNRYRHFLIPLNVFNGISYTI